MMIFSGYLFIISKFVFRFKNMWIILALLLFLAHAARKVDIPELSKVQVHDESEIVKLAEEEKFRIPLSGSTISHEIQYTPLNSGQCEFIEPSIEYKALAQSQAIFDHEDSIACILPLEKREIVILADAYFNVASYSIDRHFLMKPRLPKTNLMGSISQKKTLAMSPALVATANQDYVYLLTPIESYVFFYNNIAADTKSFTLDGSPSLISKAIESNGFIILCTGPTGILVYEIQQPGMLLKLVQTIEPQSKIDMPVDMELNQDTQLLYVLNSEKTISVYSFDSVAFRQNNKKPVLAKYDEINLETITVNHLNSVNQFELVGHINLEISRDRDEEALLVLFSHDSKTVVAEINYNPASKEYFFVRYFKFSMIIKEIHAIKDVMVVVGDGLLGMFPYGIDPHLIVEEFNGFMTLTPVESIVLTEAPFFVGKSRNQIEYGGIYLNNEAGINCHLSSSSQLKEVKFRANLTVCGDMYKLRVNKYCQYEKTFIIRQMQLTASAPVATSLWVATIIFTLLIVVGLCFLFAMHKKKEREIRKLQLYFEQKRRSSEIPASSDRHR